MIRKHVLLAVFRRNFVAYFSSPTGYVFITLFILVSAATAFLQERFFSANLANLDPLNRYFPYLLLFFAPAISMALWSEERKQGTDELLLTLPARDVELVLGKYLAAVGIYSVSLLFSLSHLVVLASLGRPDLGVMLGTYVGYWLLGAALLAVGSVASLLTSSMTVAFILGAVFCSVPVFLGDSGAVVGGTAERLLESLGVAEPFRDLAKGVLSLEALVYFGGLIGLMVYLNLVLLSRRHAAETGLLGHLWARAAAILVAAASLGVLAGRSGCRADLTQERLYSLSRETRDVLRRIDPARPVYIQAFVSPEVPQSYVETRETLLGLLREYKALGGDRIQLRVVDTERYTPEAREAEEKGIKPEKIRESREGRRATESVYLGVSFASGGEEVVIPFFHRGLPVEYELTRSVGTAGGVISGARRKRVGVVSTDVRLFGGFDFENMSSTPEWSIIAELKKQYEVSEVKLDEEIKEKYDVLLAIMPSTLPQPKMDHLLAYIQKGGAALLFDDPLPLFNPSLGPREQRRAPGSGRNPFMPPQPAEPKGDIHKLMDAIGVYWPVDDVVWDTWNPHPEMQDLPPEFVFVGPGGGNRRAFNPDDPVSAGLQEMVLLCGGQLKPRGADLSLKFTPLLTTTRRSGALGASEVLSRSFFGPGGFNPARVHRPGPGEYVLAARVRGTPPPPPPPREGEKDKAPPAAPAEIHVIVVADADMIHEQFFEMRRAGFEGLSFDNVTFVLNCVDVLAGDETYVPLRKRRPRHRTLEAVESLTKVHVDRQLEETRAAEDAAKARRDEAQARFDAKLKELKDRTDLDNRTKDIMVRNLEEVENRRLEVEKQRIDDEKESRVEKSKATMESSIRSIQKRIRVLAVLLPPVPALLIGLLVFMARIKREGMGYLAHAPAPQGAEPSGEGRKP